MTLVLHKVGAAQARALRQQTGDAADLALDRLATGLGGMRREDGMELEAGQQLVGLILAHLIDHLAVGNGELVDRVDRGIDGHAALALAQSLDAVVFLGEVRQMEERGEGADDDLGAVERQRVDQLDGVAERIGGSALSGRDTLLVGGVACRLLAGVSLVGGDDAGKQLIEDVADVLVILAQDLALQAYEQRQVVAELGGDIDLAQSFHGGARLIDVDATYPYGRLGF